MQLESVNLGQEQILQNKSRVERTGIFKFPVEGLVRVTTLGLEGDAILSKKHHGGPDQAVYVYGRADYDWWSEELKKEIAPGTFGENLTISDLESARFNVGDTLRVGEVTLQVTAPRIPCETFAARMGFPVIPTNSAIKTRHILACFRLAKIPRRADTLSFMFNRHCQ